MFHYLLLSTFEASGVQSPACGLNPAHGAVSFSLGGLTAYLEIWCQEPVPPFLATKFLILQDSPVGQMTCTLAPARGVTLSPDMVYGVGLKFGAVPWLDLAC